MPSEIMSGKVKLSDLVKAKLDMMCAWEGCLNSHEHGKMPKGWVNLLTWWSSSPDVHASITDIVFGDCCYRDACLCPEHAKALENCLKDIGNRLKHSKTEGTA